MMMHYTDKVYGEWQIDEPVLVALLASSGMDRMRGVLQHGITALLGITQPVTRFDHSAGAMLLSRRLGATTEEQIGALLHDISHTAFSHVIDHIFDSAESQSYHERKKEWHLTQTDVPAILAEFGYDWRDFLDETQFKILEQPAPALCADRVDYCLRDGLEMGLATAEQIEDCLTHLIVAEGRMVLDSVDAGIWLADLYMQMDDASWSNWREVGLYELTARAIKRGLAVEAVAEADLWTTDAQAWDKLTQTNDGLLQRMVAQINPQTEFVWDEENPDFSLTTKIRTIDPDVWQAGKLQKLSHLMPAFKRRRADYLDRKSGVWHMRVKG